MAQKRRDNKVIIISLITVICTWCGSCSSDRAFTDNYTVDNVATSYKLWVVQEFLISCRKKKKRPERGRHLRKKLIIVYNSSTLNINNGGRLHLLFAFDCFIPVLRAKKHNSGWKWSTLHRLFPHEVCLLNLYLWGEKANTFIERLIFSQPTALRLLF